MELTLASLLRIKQVLDSDAATLIVIGTFIVGGILLFKLIDALQTMGKVRQQELTRREVAAYVAEGTMTPEAAEKILGPRSEISTWESEVAELLSWGTIDAEEAERLIKIGRTARSQSTNSGAPAPGAAVAAS